MSRSCDKEWKGLVMVNVLLVSDCLFWKGVGAGGGGAVHFG